MPYRVQEPEQPSDQRKERRWNIPIPVSIKGVRSDGTEFTEETITADASRSGMNVLLTVELRTGDQVTLSAPDERFESPATIGDVRNLGSNVNRTHVILPKGTIFSRASAAKKYVYNYDLENWVGYILDGIYYNFEHEPFGKVRDGDILSLDSGEILFDLSGDRMFDIHGNCIGHII